MGLFDSIIRSVKREVENDVARAATNAAMNTIQNAFDKNNSINNINNNNTPTPAPANTVTPPQSDRYQGFVIPNNNGSYQPAEAEYRDDGSVIIDGIDYSQRYNCDRSHFRDILKNSFPEMTLREDVPVNEIIPGLNGAYQSVTFLLSEGDVPKVAIQTRYGNQPSKAGTSRQFKQHGIGYISLWTKYKNEPAYVEKRVKEALWN